jgi:hypothetical protein
MPRQEVMEGQKTGNEFRGVVVAGVPLPRRNRLSFPRSDESMGETGEQENPVSTNLDGLSLCSPKRRGNSVWPWSEKG